MILLSFFKFVEDELDNRYYLRMKDCGLMILLLNLLYISFIMFVEVIYNFSLMSFIIGYIIHHLLSLDTLLKYFEKLYQYNKHYFITLLSKMDSCITQFLNDRKNTDCDEVNNDNSNKSKEESNDLDEISNISITPISSESDNDIDVNGFLSDSIENNDTLSLGNIEKYDESVKVPSESAEVHNESEEAHNESDEVHNESAEVHNESAEVTIESSNESSVLTNDEENKEEVISSGE